MVGPDFSSTGTPANYVLAGLAAGADAALAVRETGSALLLDPNYGEVSANAQGGTGNSIRLRLLTNVSDANAGLNRSRSFAASLRLDLAALPDPGQSFGLRFTDNFSNNSDVIELSLTGATNGGHNIVLRKQDFVARTVTVLGSVPLVVPDSAGALVLSLNHNAPNTDTISGNWAFADAAGALMTPFTGFSTTANAFNGEVYTRIELRATGLSAPIPEPGAWALLAAGLGLLALLRPDARRPPAARA